MYVEKPLGVSMAWAWELRKAVARNGVVFQYGTQQRSSSEFTRAVELVRNGYIGKVHHADAWCSGMRSPGDYARSISGRARPRARGPRLRHVDRSGADEAVHEVALQQMHRCPEGTQSAFRSGPSGQ
jgi:predicted dehydrogenase